MSASGRNVHAIAALIAAVLAATAAGSAPAQAPENPPAAWRVECTGDGKTLDCRAVQQVFHRETRQLVLSVAVWPAADGKSGAMIMQLPLGLNLVEPITIKVDNGVSERQPIQTCTNVAGRQQEADRDGPAAARLRPRVRQGEIATSALGAWQ